MDKEYCELGVKEGWLELSDIITVDGETTYQYRYPDTYKCE
jgi:hypothetical protein